MGKKMLKLLKFSMILMEIFGFYYWDWQMDEGGKGRTPHWLSPNFGELSLLFEEPLRREVL